jgi:hypothetical protein
LRPIPKEERCREAGKDNGDEKPDCEFFHGIDLEGGAVGCAPRGAGERRRGSMEKHPPVGDPGIGHPAAIEAPGKP